MTNVVPFPERERGAWVCNCGCRSHFVYDDGTVACAACGADGPSGAWVKLPPGTEVDGVEATSTNRVFDGERGAELAARILIRQLEKGDFSAACVVHKNGRVSSVVTEYATTDEDRAWWRHRIVDFLHHVFGEVVR